MTDEELLGYLRRSSVGYTHPLRLAADRIEELLKERDRYRAAFNTNCLVLRGTEERVERLEAALREIIDEDQHQSEWRYWEKEDGHWSRKARAALKGDDHE